MSAAVAVFGIALLAALLYAVLEKQAPAHALLLSLGAALVLLVRAGTSIRTVLSGIARLAGQKKKLTAGLFPALYGVRLSFC